MESPPILIGGFLWIVFQASGIKGQWSGDVEGKVEPCDRVPYTRLSSYYRSINMNNNMSNNNSNTGNGSINGGNMMNQQYAQPQQVQQQQQQAPFYNNNSPETEDLKRFLVTAPQMWTKADDPPIRSYQLSNGENISCIYWRGKFFITGTDIVKILIFRFAQAGRPVLNAKKFEEGIFSDLRNLKSGTEAVLEEPKSEFLDFLFRHGCIRTQKKQKVFFWNCVPHESLFLDAIERDFKREGSLYHMNMMMNHTRYLQKQVAMMQASAIQQQYTGNGPAAGTNGVMMPPPPQMMPNTTSSRSSSFSGPSSGNGLYSQNSSNTVDPFLMSAAHSPRLLNSKINLNGPMLMTPNPVKAPISRLNSSSANNNLFDPFSYGDFDGNTAAAMNFSGEDPILSDYFAQSDTADMNTIDNNTTYIDPSTLLNLHEY